MHIRNISVSKYLSDVIVCLEKLSNNKIISCSKHKTIKVWDIDEGICLEVLNGHTEACIYRFI
jgi:WD40 repeat protein